MYCTKVITKVFPYDKMGMLMQRSSVNMHISHAFGVHGRRELVQHAMLDYLQ